MVQASRFHPARSNSDPISVLVGTEFHQNSGFAGSDYKNYVFNEIYHKGIKIEMKSEESIK